ncbi:MAG: NrtR DNA-binding winged helix domain-containing protein [Dysgonomonas sp.]
MQFFVGHIPIGYELLPKKFTMPELRIIYETILRRSLDRRNFQRKMLSLGLFNKLNETRKCGAHKSPHLYEFNEKKYKTALEYGFNLVLN